MHWGYHRLESSCDLAGAAECRDFITVRPCSWSTSRPAWSPSRLFASSGANCAGKPSETSSLRKWAWGRCMKRLFRRSGPGATEHRRCRGQQALREAGFLHMHRRTWGHPNMSLRSLNKHAGTSAGRCNGSQAVWEVEPAGK